MKLRPPIRDDVATVPPLYTGLPHSCEAFGVCLHPKKQCTGSCEAPTKAARDAIAAQPNLGNVADEAHAAPDHAESRWLLVGVGVSIAAALTLLSGGGARYVQIVLGMVAAA